MKMFESRLIEETKVYQGKITLDDLRIKFDIPPQAKVTIRVPGGGDWSNQDIELDNKENVINVSWTTKVISK